VKHKVKHGFGFHSIGDCDLRRSFALGKGIVRGVTTVAASLPEEFAGTVRNITASGGTAAGGAAGGAADRRRVGHRRTRCREPDRRRGRRCRRRGGRRCRRVRGAKQGQGRRGRLASPIRGAVGRGSYSAGQERRSRVRFLPGGQLHEEQTTRAKNVTVAGHGLTTGRLVAAAVSEPGTKAHSLLSGLIDFAGAVKADPGALAFGEVGKARVAARLFNPEDAGLIAGIRRTVATDRVAEWLDGPAGRKVIDGLAEDSNFDSVWRRTGKKLDVEDALAISKMTDPAEVRGYLEPRLGAQIREKPTLGDMPWTNPIVRRFKDARIWQDVPGRAINFDDPNGAVEQVDRFLRNANIRDPEVIAKHTTAMAEAAVAGSPGDRYQAVKAVGDTVREAIKEGLRSKDGSLSTEATRKARQLTDLFVNRHEELVKFNVDDIGDNAWFPGVKVGRTPSRPRPRTCSSKDSTPRCCCPTTATSAGPPRSTARC
jgi:hypothetical protein